MLNSKGEKKKWRGSSDRNLFVCKSNWKKCLSIEQRIIDLINKYDMKIQLRLIPIMNLKTVSEFMQRIGASEKDIELRTELSQEIHSAALDVKAAHLQGKKRGRDFWSSCKKRLVWKSSPIQKSWLFNYSPKLVETSKCS